MVRNRNIFFIEKWRSGGRVLEPTTLIQYASRYAVFLPYLVPQKHERKNHKATNVYHKYK